MPEIAQDMPQDVFDLMAGIGFPFDKVAHNCHAVSVAIVKHRLYDNARVARGWAKGVGSQHSWVAIDGDPYDPDGRIIDATLWSYDPTVSRVWAGRLSDGVHKPHGAGHFMTVGMPYNHGDREIRLIINRPMSERARNFLRMLGPLDYKGWWQVAHLPVEGWPAREIIEAMLDTPALAVLVPVDIVGMITDRNPQGIYLP
jgi:hypothetical protein